MKSFITLGFVLFLVGCSSVLPQGLSGGSIDCGTLLSPSEVQSTCVTGPLTMETDEFEGKYFNLCDKRFMSGKTQKFSIEVTNANQEAFDGGYNQRVGSDGNFASSVREGKRIDGLGTKAYQFKDGPSNRIEFRQGSKNMGLNADSETCSFEQVLTLAKLMSGRLPQ